ncbi:MAG: Asp-tRNA(Asn)/Glu-tRNA(Gln) amidotransferase subunit GatA [Deltaproteobacteria bacterium]|jgi:aspartyl-tRNA(Asn)/glutamyl-tRNA(Gln) amidotransferase subunit A
MDPVLELDGTSVAERLREGHTTPSALLDLCLARIRATEDLNAFITVDDPRAAAEAADQRFAEGRPLSAIDGVPIALKDLIATEGLRTTAGSKMLADWVPPYDATVTKRLRAAGAVIVGKTNLDEFAMGSSNEHSAYGAVKNPRDPTRVPGGSSGGSAAAVAAHQVYGALGTDTGGSIRQPAAMCGIVGLKPTYGRVSRRGVVAFASSLDQVGPMGRSVRDVAALFDVIAGHDPEDMTSRRDPAPNTSAALDRGVEGLRVGVPEAFFTEGLAPEIDAAVREGIRNLEARGATVQPVDLPHTKYALSTYYILCTAEASSNLARYDGLRYGHHADAKDLIEHYERSRGEGFGREVQRRIILGTYVLSAGYYDAYYLRAQKVRTLIRRDFERAFDDVDVIATPTTPQVAFEIGAKTRNPLEMYLSDVYTLSVNLAGLPGVSVPVGDRDGLPIGLQLIGKWFDEAGLLATAAAVEASQSGMQAPGEPIAPKQ